MNVRIPILYRIVLKSLLTPALMLALQTAGATEFDVRISAEFCRIVATNSELKKLAGGMKFVEGPVWVAKGNGHLIFSNIPDNELKQWDAIGGLTTFRTDTHSANGNCLDRQGHLISCEGGARRVSLTERDGSVHALVDQIDGKKFNAPNDVVVKSDGTVWFTDPDYGLSKPKEVPGMYVYRLEPKTGKIAAVVTDCDHPNGLCFSPDEKRLYVADSGKPHHIRVYDVDKKSALSNSRIFCVIDKGVPDGIRCDTRGRVFSSAGDGVQIFDVKGELIGKILVPEVPANLCFGGKDKQTLFITARTSLYAIPVLVKGDK
jgi:gluconolactonase